jgi:hypothetical protein
MSTTQPPFTPGVSNVLGRYRLDAHSATGRHFDVWRATDLALNRAVAIKIAREVDQTAMQRFRREAKLLTGLVHPNVVQLLDVAETEAGKPYMVVEWVSGSPLSTLMNERGRFDWVDVARLGRAVAWALQYTHDQAIIHSDVKPANILVPNGALEQAKLTDFSVLGELSQDDPTLGRLTMAGLVVGTPLYMAPEQLSGASLSNRTDLYSLGLVMRNMLWGEPATVDTFKLLAERVSSTSELPADPSMPAEFRALLAMMTRRQPELRPVGANTVVSVLDRLLQTPPARAGDVQAANSETLTTEVTTAIHVTMPKSAVPAPARSSRSRLVVLGVAALAALAVTTTVLFWRTGAHASNGSSAGASSAMGVMQGIGLMVTGVLLGLLAGRAIEYRRSDLERKVSLALSGSRDRENLSRTMVVAVDAIIQQTSKLDARFLGATLIGMVHEYDSAKESADKQQALVRATELLEKLLEKTSPWYVRNSKWVVAGASVIGLASGAVKLVGEVAGTFR